MIIRSPRPESQFLMISNEVLRDERLSYRARGLLAAILSHTDNWRVNSEDLTKHGLEGRGAVRAALSELEEFGYLVREKVQNEKGQWITNSYIFDKPKEKDENVDLPTTGLPKADFRSSVSRSLLEEPSLNTIKKDTEVEETSPEISEICFYLAKAIENRGLKTRPFEVTVNGSKWRSEASLLLRGKIGHKDTLEDCGTLTVNQIKGAIDYAMNDTFWATVIFSPAALRRDYPRLRAQALAGKQKVPKSALPASNNPVTQIPRHRGTVQGAEGIECQACAELWPCSYERKKSNV